jgi:hypothetical protein
VRQEGGRKDGARSEFDLESQDSTVTFTTAIITIAINSNPTRSLRSRICAHSVQPRVRACITSEITTKLRVTHPTNGGEKDFTDS